MPRALTFRTWWSCQSQPSRNLSGAAAQIRVRTDAQPNFVDGGRSRHNTKLKRTLYNRHFCLEFDGAHLPLKRVRTQGGDAPDGEADGE